MMTPQEKIGDALKELRKATSGILIERHGGANLPERVSHYTDLATVSSVLQGEGVNRLRLYDIAGFNDPDEGMTFVKAAVEKDVTFSFLYGENDEDWRKNVRNIVVGKINHSAYVCAFSGESDRLDLWRAYGRNGEGCSITVKIVKGMKTMSDYDLTGFIGIGDSDIQNKNTSDAKVIPHDDIFKVRYGDSEEGAEKAVSDLSPILKKLKRILESGVSEEEITQAKNAARETLSILCYLYKHPEYRTEDEYRMLRAVDIESEDLKCDERIPPRLYVETSSFLFTGESESKIIIGPRVSSENQTAFEIYARRQLIRNGWRNTATIADSKIKYR